MREQTKTMGRPMPRQVLKNRGVLRIGGEDAKDFLDGILTCDLDRVSPATARFGALLNPQGKILFDFFIIGAPATETPGYYVDCAAERSADLARRLSFYRLRAKVTVEALGDDHRVTAIWDGDRPEAAGGIVFADPRLERLGFRLLGPATGTPVDAGYEAHRIGLGVPDATLDFGPGDAFPHEMMMDQLHGVDFDKGCYVGQEVVSRMQHRSTARTRVLTATTSATLPTNGAEIASNGKLLGRMGSSVGRYGLALVRIDRVGEAMREGADIVAEGVVLRLAKPDYARFEFPLAG